MCIRDRESPGYREFMRCIEVMDHMCGERPYGYQLAVKGALFGFLFQVFTHYREAVPEGSRKYREKIKTLLRHIEDHYGDRLTVEEAAGMCFYSKSHFMKFFQMCIRDRAGPVCREKCDVERHL